MPNRILRDGILTSERVNALNWEAEVFYRRLMSVVDDFGRYTAHPALLRAALYPLKLDAVRDANMERLLAIVVQARLVRVYEVAEKRYLELLDFKQQVRAKESKYPHPPAGAQHVRSTCIAGAQQVPADARLDGGGGGDVYGDVDEIPPTPRAHEVSHFEKFRMPADWQPSPHLATLAKQAGLPMPESAEFDAAKGEFVAYWLTRVDTAKTQHEWDHALVKNLKADRLQGRVPNGPTGSRPSQRSAPRETFRERDSRLMAEKVAAFAPGVAAQPAPTTIDLEHANALALESR